MEWEFDKEPGVIDETMIYGAVVSQGPKGEEGKIFIDQGIIYQEINYLRLEFFDILKIDHLWTMTGLTTLNLSNNIIEKIESLECLINLEKLDLSFNNIRKIENLDTLVNLQSLSLFENKITIIENMNHMKKLQVLSIGNNLLDTKNNILYLRQFKCLQSLNLAGNPMCKDPTFRQFIYAYLPQLVYYEYKMILDEQRREARQAFAQHLMLIEGEEFLNEKEQQILKDEEEQEERNKKAFVEYLGGQQLFNSIFKNDPDGYTFLEMGDEINEAYKEFMKNFCTVTKELHAFGLIQHEERVKVITEYEINVKEGKDKLYKESREIVMDFLTQKKKMFKQIRGLLDEVDAVEEEQGMAELSLGIQEINDTFQKLCLHTWKLLMHKELYLCEAMEKALSTLERSLTQLINDLLEASQAKFTQLRALEGIYHDATVEISEKYITTLTLLMEINKDARANYSSQILAIMSDKESLANATAASHDSHQLTIDTREDQLTSSAKGWLRKHIDDLTDAEIKRNRNQVIEIIHFFDSQKDELQAMTCLALQDVPSEFRATGE